MVNNKHKKKEGPALRRGGAAFVQDTSKFKLQCVKPERRFIKSAMKVATLEDSLRSTESSMTKILRHRVSSLVSRASTVSSTSLETSSAISKPSRKANFPVRDSTPAGAETSKVELEEEEKPPSLERTGESFRNGSGSILTTQASSGDVIDASNNIEAKRFGFKNIEIREYETIVTDNPGVSRGAAIGIGWTYVEMDPISVDDYEKYHPPRRTMKEIKLTMRERMNRLAESGFTQREIQEMTKKATIARNKRRATLERIHLHGAQERLNYAMRKFVTFIGLRRNTKYDEGALWDKAQEVKGCSS